MNQITADELEKHDGEGYSATEMVGRYGLERAWESFLRGKRGLERFVVNARGERVEGKDTEGLIEGPKYVPPVAGHNLILTIDLGLQEKVEALLNRQPAGAVAVIQVDTGRILALASTPSFDPNVMTGHLTREKEAQMLSDPRKPFIDKTLRQFYPPGSTYKFVTGLAALEDSLTSEAEPLTCPGYLRVGRRTFRCEGRHEKVNMLTALQHSCNVYFWKLSERVGIDRMAEVAREFGFGEPAGLGLNGDLAGLVPTKAWYEERDVFKIGNTLNAATGQGDVEVGVLQLAMAYAALANGRRLFVPQVVDRVETASGEVVASYEPQLKRVVDVSQENVDIILRGLYKVVNEPGGTAYEHARVPWLPYGAKTGTAQVKAMRRRSDDEGLRGWHPDRDHAWIAGFAPFDSPEIAFVVLLEHGGSGGRNAGPIAKAIVEDYFADRKPDDEEDHH
jgi:penicillin-binding protein 2